MRTFRSGVRVPSGAWVSVAAGSKTMFEPALLFYRAPTRFSPKPLPLATTVPHCRESTSEGRRTWRFVSAPICSVRIPRRAVAAPRSHRLGRRNADRIVSDSFSFRVDWKVALPKNLGSQTKHSDADTRQLPGSRRSKPRSIRICSSDFWGPDGL